MTTKEFIKATNSEKATVRRVGQKNLFITADYNGHAIVTKWFSYDVLIGVEIVTVSTKTYEIVLFNNVKHKFSSTTTKHYNSMERCLLSCTGCYKDNGYNIIVKYAVNK